MIDEYSRSQSMVLYVRTAKSKFEVHSLIVLVVRLHPATPEQGRPQIRIAQVHEESLLLDHPPLVHLNRSRITHLGSVGLLLLQRLRFLHHLRALDTQAPWITKRRIALASTHIISFPERLDSLGFALLLTRPHFLIQLMRWQNQAVSTYIRFKNGQGLLNGIALVMNLLSKNLVDEFWVRLLQFGL